MMVSNGNLTGLVDRLVESGHLERRVSKTDRRSQVISLTRLGRAEFRQMASAHEGWIADLFADLTKKEREGLMAVDWSAPAGPPIWNRLPPSAETMNPPTMAVNSPLSGLTPEAMAIAIDNGSATIATVSPAIMSA